MSKKRKKNSDYHYAERRDNAERIQAQKAERKKTTRKEKIIYFGAFLLLIVALIIWVVTRKNGMGESIQDRAYIVAISATLLLTLFMTTNKVFSTQYLAWLIPLIWVYGALRSDRFMLQISVNGQYAWHLMVD